MEQNGEKKRETILRNITGREIENGRKHNVRGPKTKTEEADGGDTHLRAWDRVCDIPALKSPPLASV